MVIFHAEALATLQNSAPQPEVAKGVRRRTLNTR